MDRRTFIGALASGLLTAPLTVAAQRVPRVGVLWPNPPATFDVMRKSLADLGYIEGRSINFEYLGTGQT